ncbi:MAG: N-acetyl-gamma-glutamyl-phosphate reductase [Alphaproteobacteria bacterium]|nr:MAG: N-acetyl-gamma-glutamyl-phosphate reductase [Alphaproteobacteria bacterium]TAF15581.1 MAG: N-acetyl-gamma-glutamyl-phosphate reductase [Alphaproteobacteria bacterium]TAF41985.1 MAG: N-acetyl-gamma-glutamyl-phosphate reductase [Alphaproteobacteria bacterium]TAF76593.1 MAG: N-acetyl-gamma-glutamyl-phosphate reductase [Alphaproteobacteria bacterium]
MAQTRIRCAIIGASGYTGAELIRLLRSHPHADIAALSANSHAGQHMQDVFPHLFYDTLPPLTTTEAINFDDIDVAFCCLPHATSQKIIATLPKHLKIIDLSADFRLVDAEAYRHWYGEEHHAPALQAEALYGLTEHYRTDLPNHRLIANPGCYPTCSLLPLLPLAKAGMLEADPVIIDAKSGVSGAGRTIKQGMLYNEVSEGMTAYSVNHHRHMGELHQELGLALGAQPSITFVPHLIPQKRGMVATIYARLQSGYDINAARAQLHQTYANEPFVHLMPQGNVPSTHSVRGSNHCLINIFAGSDARSIILISVIDNLMKGASGQAVQNMNLLCGFPETEGLMGSALFP